MDIPPITPETAQIFRFKSVDSTNNILKKIAGAGAASGSVVVADTQTSGRGRGEKHWVSPEGGLWFSYLYRGALDLRASARMSVALALAVRKLLDEECRLPTTVAWPNDVMATDKKIAGILSETSQDVLVAGIGINLNIALDNMPRQVDKPATSVLIELGQSVDRERLIPRLQQHVTTYLESPLETIQSEYQQYAYWRDGEAVSVMDRDNEQECFVATVLGLNFQNGEFRVRDSEGAEHILEIGKARIVKRAQ